MHKHVACIMLAVVVLLGTSAAYAGITVVDPDAFAEGTDISNAFAGITLSAVGTGGWGNSTNAIYAVNPSSYWEPFNASTDSLVFGTNAPSYPHLFREDGFMQLRIDFADPILGVQLDFIGNDPAAGSFDIGELKAYNASGVQVDVAVTPALIRNQIATLSVSGAEITYIVAGGIDQGSSLGMDNLAFEFKDPDPDPDPDPPVTVPAPGAILLGTLGMSLVGWLRRRRTL